MRRHAAQAVLRRISWSWWVLLELHRRGETLSPLELAERYGVASKLVGRHLRELRDLGLVDAVPPLRGAGSAYRLSELGRQWLEAPLEVMVAATAGPRG